VINNKVYSAIKVSLFIANYDREMKIGATEFAERMKKV